MVDLLLKGRAPVRLDRVGRSWVHGPWLLDPVTSLMWRRCALGQMLNDAGHCVGTALLLGGNVAIVPKLLEYANANSGGYADWRLPTADELKSLMDTDKGDRARGLPYIDGAAFPDLPKDNWQQRRFVSAKADNRCVIIDFDNALTDEGCVFRYGVLLVRDRFSQ